jgi:hypothetical protein
MSDIFAILLLVALVLGMLAATTFLGIARLESAQPTGQFVEVQGVGLHVAVIGLPCAKLVLLKDIGHMPYHAAPEVVATAIDKLIPRARIPWANPRLIGNSALAA